LVAALLVPSVASAVSPTPTKPTAVSAALGSFNVGVTVSALLSADGSPAPTFAVTHGTLPVGLSLQGALITGTLTTLQFYSFEITASNSEGAARATFSGNVRGAVAPTALSSEGHVTSGDFVSTRVSADGSPAPTLALTGTLPQGLSFDATTGVIAGHAQPGPLSVTFTATNSAGSVSAFFTGNVAAAGQSPTVVFGSMGTLAVGVPVSTLVTADGVPAPTFAVTNGTMPDGLVLASNGAITGTPTTTGHHSFEITATNSTATTAITAFDVNVARATRQRRCRRWDAGRQQRGPAVGVGGWLPLKFVLTAGAMPAGLTSIQGTVCHHPASTASDHGSTRRFVRLVTVIWRHRRVVREC
jgi:hypothetical protein